MKRTFFRRVVILLPLLLIGMSLLPPPKVHAAVIASWKNVKTITYAGNDFVDGSWTDDKIEFSYTGSDGCTDKINGFHNGGDRVNDNGDVDSSNPDAGDTHVKLTLSSVKTTGGNCQDDKPVDLTLTNVDHRLVTFRYVDEATIESLITFPYGSISAGEKFITVAGTPGSKFWRASEFDSQGNPKKCNDYLSVGISSGSTQSAKMFEQDVDNPIVNYQSDRETSPDGSGCSLTNGVGAGITDGTVPNVHIDTAAKSVPKGKGTSDVPATTTQSNALGLHCDPSFTNPLTWIMCPLIDGAVEVINQLDTEISDLLTIKSDVFFGTGQTADNFHSAWSSIRNFAMALIFIAALVMVAAQALSIGAVDAYTIRKVLPRLFIAVIGIAISWPLIKLAVDFSNDLGRAIRSVIEFPFRGSFGSTNLGNATTGLSLGVGGLVVLASTMTIIGTLSFVATGALAVIIALFVIVTRQVLMVLLAVLAPFAIACFVLPNTERVWKLWQEWFFRGLMLFPIIEAFISSGRVFASVAPQVTSDALFGGIIAFIAYFGPYFALPTAFRLAGGAVASIGGLANDRTRGVFDRLKNFRGNESKKAIEANKAGNRFKGENAFSRRASRAIQTATLAPAGGFTLDINKRRSRMETARSSRNFDLASEAIQNNAALGAIKGDDDKLWAMMNGTNEASVRAELRKRAPGRFIGNQAAEDLAVADVMRAKRELGENVGRIAATRAQAGTGTGYNYNPDFQNGEDDMLNAIISASGSDRGLAGRMLAEMRGAATQSGRVDLGGGGFALQAMTMDKRRQAIADPNGQAYVTDDRGHMLDAHGNVTTDINQAQKTRFNVDDARRAVLQDVLNSNAGAAIAGKKRAVEELAPVMLENVTTPISSGDTKKAARELAKIAGKYDAASQVAPQNAEVLANEVLAKEIDIASLTPQMKGMLGNALVESRPDGSIASRLTGTITVQQAVEALRGNTDFQEMRREYQTAGIAAANAAAQQQPGNPINPNPGSFGGGPAGT